MLINSKDFKEIAILAISGTLCEMSNDERNITNNYITSNFMPFSKYLDYHSVEIWTKLMQFTLISPDLLARWFSVQDRVGCRWQWTWLTVGKCEPWNFLLSSVCAMKPKLEGIICKPSKWHGNYRTMWLHFYVVSLQLFFPFHNLKPAKVGLFSIYSTNQWMLAVGVQ